MSRLINLAGRRFGRLKVLGRARSPRKAESNHSKRTFWACLCICGKKTIVESHSLRSHTRSCGCGREVSHLIHGQARHPESGKRDQIYAMYHNAKQRAKRNGLEFNLCLKDVVLPKTCPVLGIPLFRAEGGMQDNSPTLDRIRLHQGYIKNNIAVISWRANRLKADAEIWEVEKILKYMRKHGRL